MSAYRNNKFRKRRSDDDSSGNDGVVPPVKKLRSGKQETTFKQVLAEKCQSLFKWIFHPPNNRMIYPGPMEVMDKDNIENQDIILVDDDDEDITKLAAVEKENISYLKGSDLFPKPITTSTPFYKDGTMVGYKHKVSSRNGYHGKDPQTKENFLKSQKQPRSSSQYSAPLSNPGVDIEILLDTREINSSDSKDLEIVSEISRDKRSSNFSRPLMSPISMYDGASVKPRDTSDRSVINGKDPSTSRQSSKSFVQGGTTAHEVVRLQEKALYQELLQKMVHNSTAYRPVKKNKVAPIEVDLTQDEDEKSVIGLPFNKEYLQKPVGDLLENYYKPCKLVTKTSSQQDEPAKEKENAVALPQYRRKIKTKADFFDPSWIQELKISLNEETEKRLQAVRQEETKLKRFRERRDAKFEEERLLFEKYRVPGDVFPEQVTERLEFPEFSPEMEILIKESVRQIKDHDIDEMCSFNGITVLRKHMGTLDGDNWLIDEILNFYLNLIMERSKLDNYPSVYAYSTFFYSSLRSRGISSILRWTRKVDIFSYDILFIPLHLEVHWALCVVDNRIKTIRYFDSMGSGQTDMIIRPIHAYLIEEMKAKKNITMDPNEYTLEVVKGLPKQMNGSDCGMFTLKYAECVSRDAPILFEQAHITYFRRRMVYEIMTKQLM